MSYLRTDYGKETVIKLNGILGTSTLPEFNHLVNQLLDEQRTAIRLDMSDLELIDKKGVSVIAHLIKETRDLSGNVEIVGIKDQPKAYFKLLSRMLPM